MKLYIELLMLYVSSHPLFALSDEQSPQGYVTHVLVYLEGRDFLHWNHRWLQHLPLPGPPTSLLMLVLGCRS